MTRRLRLESFERSSAEIQREAEVEAESQRRLAQEEARLTAFDQGYAAGWDDAVAAQDEETVRLRSELGRNLQQLSFTYAEARTHVLRAVEPLLADMVAKVLPAVARAALGGVVLEAIAPMLEEQAGAPVEVRLNPRSRATVEAILAAEGGPPFRVIEEPTLDETQVFLRLGRAERIVDLGGVVAAIETALSAYFLPLTEEQLHG